MKKVLLSLLVIVMFIGLPAIAQVNIDDDKGMRLGLKGGWVWPQGTDLTDTIENNWIVGADATLFFSRNFGVGVDIRYSSKSVTSLVEEIDADINWASMPLSINGIFRTKIGSSTLYFGAGGTMIQTTYGAELLFGDLSFGQEESVWAYGVDAVAGLETRKFFLEAQIIISESEFNEVLVVDDESGTMNTGTISIVAGYRF